MKSLLALLLLFAAVNLNQGQDLSGSDLFQRFLDVENELKEQWKNNYEGYKNKQKEVQERQQAANDKLTEAFKQKYSEIKAVYDNIREQQQQKQAEKDQEKQEIMDELRTAYSNIMVARNETKEKERQQINDLMNKLKEKWDQKQEEAAEEKKQEIVDFKNAMDQMREKWNDFLVQMDEAKKERWEKQQEKMEKARQDLAKLKQLMQEEKKRREEARQQREQQYNAKVDQYRSDIQAKKDEMDQLEQEIMQKMQEIQSKKQEINTLMQNAMLDETRKSINEKMYKKFQDSLDQAAAKEIINEMYPQLQKEGSRGHKGGGSSGGRLSGGRGDSDSSSHQGFDLFGDHEVEKQQKYPNKASDLVKDSQKGGGSSQTGGGSTGGRSTQSGQRVELTTGKTLEETWKDQEKIVDKIGEVIDKVDNEGGEYGKHHMEPGVSAEPRATILDEITGTSQWQTVTWILLALSILLAVALVALVMYQIAQKKYYQSLDQDERTPLTRSQGSAYMDVGTSTAPQKSILVAPKSKALSDRLTTLQMDDPSAPVEPVI